MIRALSMAMAGSPRALLLCIALAACADRPPSIDASENLYADASFAPPSERVEAADIFAVSPQMRAYLDSRVAEEAERRGEARALVEALFRDRRLHIDYDATYTRNAAQAFEARAGNCLSLAIVTGAMARQMGLEVQYQSVHTSEYWTRDGDLMELVGHVNVTVGVHTPKAVHWVNDRDRWTVDFMAPAEIKDMVSEPISEARVAAMFMNNRAAEALARQRTDDAYWWLRGGIRVDPGFASLYNTLGVTYLRKGLLPQAESALRHALSIDRYSRETWSNLAIVLRHEGRIEEAVAIEEKHPASKAATLAATIEGSRQANESGDYDRALELLKRALRTAPDNHEVHYLLAVTYLNLGDRRRAMDQLLLARDDSVTALQRSVYTSKVELLKSRTSEFRLDPEVLRTN